MNTGHSMGDPDAAVATAELAAVLAELGLSPKIDGARPTDEQADLHLPGGIEIEVKASARPTLSWLHRANTRDGSPHIRVLVADRVEPGLRNALAEAGWGWLDRSGHLRLVSGQLQIDRDIPSLLGPETRSVDPLARPSGLAVALTILEHGAARSVRDIAAAASVSPGSAHRALTELESLGLVADGDRRDPDLFWAVASRWAVRWYPLASGPLPGIPEAVQRLLRMEFDHSEQIGWAMVGDVPAQHFGARVGSEGPDRLYVPDQRALTWSLRTWGLASDERDATALVAVAPTTAALAPRRDTGASEFLFARPMVVALDFASDGSPRSREVLEDWDPSAAGIDRVW